MLSAEEFRLFAFSCFLLREQCNGEMGKNFTYDKLAIAVQILIRNHIPPTVANSLGEEYMRIMPYFATKGIFSFPYERG
jgi:hypothetical protein